MGKRGRPRTGKKNSQELRSETKQRLKDIGRRSRKFVYLTCKICKQERQIRIDPSHVDLYTDELRKNYICILCR